MTLTRDQARALLAHAGQALDLTIHDARLLHLHSNAIFALPSSRLVVRIATNPDAFDNIAASVAITRWLHERGFPCTVPADIEQPIKTGGHVVSLWRLVDTVPEPPGNGAELGRLLRTLHDAPSPPVPLGVLADPLASVTTAVERANEGIARDDRQWVLDRISVLRARWDALAFTRRPCLIHGDAHPNNLIRTTSGGVVLGDWDHVAVGPREWDLAQAHYMHRRFGRLSKQELEEFTSAYGWDVRDWPGAHTLIEVREISGLSPYIRSAPHNKAHQQEILHRLSTLRAGDTSARWNPPART